MLATMVRHLPGIAARKQAGAGAKSGTRLGEVVAPVDLQRLRTLGSENPAMRRAVINVLRSELALGTTPIDEALTAWQQGRHQDAARVFHTLRGSLGTFATPEFIATLQRMEQAILRQDGPTVEAALPAIKHRLAALLEEMSHWLAEQQSDDVAAAPAGLTPDELQRFVDLLGEQDVAACKHYDELRGGLQARLDGPSFIALEQAMNTLDFAVAGGIVQSFMQTASGDATK